MNGISLHADFDGLKRLSAAIQNYADLDRRALLDQVGGLLENQTKRRIEEDKTSPEGLPWQPWSERYAKTRHSNQSLLIGEGHLKDGITHNVLSENELEWGSPEIYSTVQQLGWPDRNIPARAYLGISTADGIEIERATADYLAAQAEKGLQ